MDDIKVICFDLDNTLIDRDLGADETYRQMICEFSNYKRGTVEFECILQDILNKDEYGNCNKKVLYNFLNEKGFRFTYQQMLEWWYENLGKNEPVYEDTYEVLEYLKEKYKLIVVTNGDSIGQRTKLKVNNLEKYFDEIVISQEFGCNKPDPRIYQHVSQLLNLNCKEIAFVGDTYPTDIIGAYRVGMRPIWIWNDDKRHNEDGIIRVRNLKELKNIF